MIDRFHLDGGVLVLEQTGEWTMEDAADLETWVILKSRQIRRGCEAKKTAAVEATLAGKEKTDDADQQ